MDNRRPVFVGVAIVLALMAGCSWARTKAAAPQAAKEEAASAVLTLEVKEPLGLARVRWPLSAGVPFPRGTVSDPGRLVLRDRSGSVPTQSRVLSRWADGSIRWALLDWQLDLQAHEERQLRVDSGGGPAVSGGLNIDDTGDRISIDTGPLQFSIPKRQFGMLDNVRVGGQPVTGGPVTAFIDVEGTRLAAQAPSSVTLLERGPLRARVEVRGEYASRFDYVVRIDVFANQSFVRVLHSFEQHHAEPYTTVRQIALEVPLSLKPGATYAAGQENGAPLSGTLASQGFTLFQADNEVFWAGGVRHAGHLAGWAEVGDGAISVALASRFFWQEYPQSMQLRPAVLTYNLWAPEAPPAKVGMGAAKTHELFLVFSGKTQPSPRVLTALTQPMLAHVNPQAMIASGALRNGIAPVPTTDGFLRGLAASFRRVQAHAAVDRWDDSGLVQCADAAHERPRTGLYGMFNWGDWNYPGYHDTTKGCDAWGNLEYDTTQVLALAYAATGDTRYHEAMVAAARHFMDVDRIHFQAERPAWVGMNHPKNPLHFAFELGGVDLGHTWTEGLISAYYLTGDERSLEAARGIADYLVNRLHGLNLPGNPRQTGWPLIALVAVYEATGEDRYRAAAIEYARKGVNGHPPERIGDWKVGILAEALTYLDSVMHDAAIRDWLARYAAAVAARGAALEARYYPALAYVGRTQDNAEYRAAAAATVSRLKFGNWGKPFSIAGRVGFSILSQVGK